MDMALLSALTPGRIQKAETPNSGLKHSYGVDYGTLLEGGSFGSAQGLGAAYTIFLHGAFGPRTWRLLLQGLLAVAPGLKPRAPFKEPSLGDVGPQGLHEVLLARGTP